MTPKTLVYFTVKEDTVDEVKAAIREYVSAPGEAVQVYVVPYTNRFVAILEQGGPPMERETLVQFLISRFKELPEFVELEPVAGR